MFQLQDIWTSKAQTFLTMEFELQEREIIKNNKQAFEEWLFDVDASESRIVGTMFPISTELMKAVAIVALEFAGDDETVFELSERALRYIKERVDKFARDTNEFTVTEIQNTIAEGLRNGETTAQLKKRIRDIYTNAKDVRAEMIARTEILASSNEGAIEAYRQSPIIIRKEWRVAGDSCGFCLEMDGKIVGIEENFADLGTTISDGKGDTRSVDYESVGHPPLHPNCRCVVLPVNVK